MPVLPLPPAQCGIMRRRLRAPCTEHCCGGAQIAIKWKKLAAAALRANKGKFQMKVGAHTEW